jgi:DNA-nicking Smr family endonuclease
MAAKQGSDRPKPLLGDALLWKRVQESAMPLKRRAPVPTPVGPPIPAPRRDEEPHPAARAPRPAGPPVKAAPELRTGHAPGLDRSTHDKLKRGHLPIQGKLDLHGMDRERAHRALGRYLESASTQGKRCVLVVTGKGGTRPGEPGVLKSEVPRWLNEAAMRPLILAFTPAQPRHGGAGALYVYLKRRREP